MNKTALIKQIQKIVVALGTAKDRRLGDIAIKLIEIEKELITYQEPKKEVSNK